MVHDGLDRVNGCFLRVGLVYHSKHVTKFDARRVDGGLWLIVRQCSYSDAPSYSVTQAVGVAKRKGVRMIFDFYLFLFSFFISFAAPQI